ncbi:hypothetical protein [Muribaculum intestinale]|uniref:hypothetical protein n=1 Tax=Muribaculum intestinale TaxID=1796646 RepID=UPI0025B6476C|nr:hypothetical protein [Muribaculum intestinale]
MKQSKSLMMLLSLSSAVVVSATVPVAPVESHPELRSNVAMTFMFNSASNDE